MKKPGFLCACLESLRWLPILLLPAIGIAQTGAEALKRCLQDFDGIQWKLPYRPPISIARCVSPAGAYNSGESPADGRRSLELIGELTLGAESKLSSDDTYAALQGAMFVHFDALFRRYGYRLVAQEQGDARTKYYANTMRILRGLPPLPEGADEGPALPPIPYISLARYARSVSGKEVTLIYKAEMKNTWRITIEGLAAAPVAAGAAR